MNAGQILSAKAAKAGIKAARQTVSRALDQGEHKIGSVVGRSGRTLEDGLDMIEKLLVSLVDQAGARRDAYAQAGQNRLRDAQRYAVHSLGGRAGPDRSLLAAAAGVGAGVLLALLLAKREA